MKANNFELPEDWSWQPLSKLAEIVSGGTPSREVAEYWKPADIAWVTPTDITGTDGRYLNASKERISRAGLQKSSATMLPKGTVLMTSRATLGHAKISSIECCTNQGFKSLIPKDGIPSEYLYYLIQLFKTKYEQLGIGSTFLEVSKKDTEKFLLPLAPRDARLQIAKILCCVDNQIDSTRILIKKYTSIKQGMMADFFSRGIDPETKELRPTFEEAPELYHETSLGMLPKGWDVLKLSKLAQKITDGDHHTPQRSSEGRYLLSARNIQDGFLDLSKVDYVPEHEYQRMIKRCFPEAGDILISCSGSIGRVCEVPENLKCALVRSVALVKLDINLAQSNYIGWWLRTEKMQKMMVNSALQAAQPNLFQGAIEKLDTILCPPEEQTLISVRLNSVESLIRSFKSELKKLNVQKSGLMQDLLTGRVAAVPIQTNKKKKTPVDELNLNCQQ